MKKALIFQGKLIEVSSTAFPVSPKMHWVDVGNEVTTGTHQYDGVSVVLIPAKAQAEIDAEASALAKKNLMAIDLKSVRAIREYIASKVDAPVIIKNYEAESQTERTKIK